MSLINTYSKHNTPYLLEWYQSLGLDSGVEYGPDTNLMNLDSAKLASLGQMIDYMITDKYTVSSQNYNNYITDLQTIRDLQNGKGLAKSGPKHTPIESARNQEATIDASGIAQPLIITSMGDQGEYLPNAQEAEIIKGAHLTQTSDGVAEKKQPLMETVEPSEPVVEVVHPPPPPSKKKTPPPKKKKTLNEDTENSGSDIFYMEVLAALVASVLTVYVIRSGNQK